MDKNKNRSRLNVLSWPWEPGTCAPKRNESAGKRNRAHPSERPAKRQANDGQEQESATAQRFELALGARHMCALRNGSISGKRKRARPSERPAKRQGNGGQGQASVTA